MTIFVSGLMHDIVIGVHFIMMLWGTERSVNESVG